MPAHTRYIRNHWYYEPVHEAVFCTSGTFRNPIPKAYPH
jgi:hypothetical protein